MRKFSTIILSISLAGFLLGGGLISSVRLLPQKSVYRAGEKVKILWDYSSIPSPSTVRITIWRTGASQSICRIATDVPVLTGGSGYSWTIPAKCTNPHTNAEEDLTSSPDGSLYIKVRWMGHPDWDVSPHFSIKKLIINPEVARNVLKSKKSLYQLSNLPSIYNVNFTESNRKRMLYKVVWDARNLPANARVKALLLKNGSYYCDIRHNVPVNSKLIEISMNNICQNKAEPAPGEADNPIFQIRVALENNPAIKGTTPMIKLPIYPEFKINNIRRGKTKSGRQYFYFYKVNIGNYGLKDAGFVTVKLRITDLDTGISTTLSRGGFFLKRGEEIPVVFGFEVYDPLINAQHEKAEAWLTFSPNLKEYNEDNNSIVAEFDDLTKK